MLRRSHAQSVTTDFQVPTEQGQRPPHSPAKGHRFGFEYRRDRATFTPATYLLCPECHFHPEHGDRQA